MKIYSYTAGQGNPYKKVLESMGSNILPSLHSDSKKLNDSLTENIKILLNIDNEDTYVLPIAGTGSAATEILVSNIVTKNSKIIICNNGYFSSRLEEFIRRYGGEPYIINKDFGVPVLKDEIEIAVNNTGAKIVFLVHGETSSGLLQPLEEIGEYCSKNNILFLVDCATTIGCIPFYMNKWHVNGMFTVSQKSLACSPGLSILAIDSKYLEYSKSVQAFPGFYFDINLLLSSWYQPKKYHHTHPYSLLLSVNVSISRILETGIFAEYNKYLYAMNKLKKILQNSGFKLVINEDKYQLPNLICVYTKDDSSIYTEMLLKEKSIYISKGIGELSNRIIRIGLFGRNKENEYLNYLIESINYLKK